MASLRLRECTGMMLPLMMLLLLADGKPKVQYMLKACKLNTAIYVNTSLILEVTNDVARDRDVDFTHCFVDVITSRDAQLLLAVQAVYIQEQEETPDRFHIYDFNDEGKRVRVSPLGGMYGTWEQRGGGGGVGLRNYRSSSNKLVIDYFGKPTTEYPGFRLLFTKARPRRGKTCNTGMIPCTRAGICVPAEVRCDGLVNCGPLDSSDENNCPGNTGAAHQLGKSDHLVTSITAAGVSGVTFLVVCVIVFFLVQRHNRKRDCKQERTRRRKSALFKPSMTRDQLTELYQPPSYESVVFGDEDSMSQDSTRRNKRKQQSNQIEADVQTSHNISEQPDDTTTVNDLSKEPRCNVNSLTEESEEMVEEKPSVTL